MFTGTPRQARPPPPKGGVWHEVINLKKKRSKRRRRRKTTPCPLCNCRLSSLAQWGGTASISARRAVIYEPAGINTTSCIFWGYLHFWGDYSVNLRQNIEWTVVETRVLDFNVKKDSFPWWQLETEQQWFITIVKSLTNIVSSLKLYRRLTRQMIK